MLRTVRTGILLLAALLVSRSLSAQENGRDGPSNASGTWMLGPDLRFTAVHDGNHLVLRVDEIPESVAERRGIGKGDIFITYDGELSGTGFGGTILVFDEPDPESKEVPTYKTKLRLRHDPSGVLVGEFIPMQYFRKSKQWQEKEPASPEKIIFHRPCRTVSKGTTIGEGEFAIRLSDELVPIDPGEDEARLAGYCHYSEIGVASIGIATPGLAETIRAIAPILEIRNCDVDFYLKEGGDHIDPKAYRNINLYWADDETGTYEVFDKWGIRFIVYSFSATFQTDENGQLSLAEGSIEFQMDVDGDVHLSGPVFLSGDLASLIRYEWTDSQSWADGKWEFDGFAGVELQVRRNGVQPVATFRFGSGTAGVFDGQMDLNGATSWEIGKFHVELTSCSLAAEVNLRDGTWRILSGAITGTISADKPVDGKLVFSLSWNQGTFSIAIRSDSDIKAFNTVCQDLSLRVDLDPNTLTFTEVSGSLSFKHEEFDAALRIQEFVLKNGRLEKFIGAGQVHYHDFLFKIGEISYTAIPNRPASLSIKNATLFLGWSKGQANASIDEFSIEQDGRISKLSFQTSIATSPIDVRFRAFFDESRFEGRFDGKFAGEIKFGGEVVVGIGEEEFVVGTEKSLQKYPYGFLRIKVGLGRGIIIPNTGLKLVGLNGGFGCNYLPADAPGFASPRGASGSSARRAVGRPDYGTYYIEAGISISDLVDIAMLNGTVKLTLGSSTAIGITGTLTVPRKASYFEGTLSCNYVPATHNLYGSLKCTVRIPKNGDIVDFPSNRVNYSMGPDEWYLKSEKLGGQLVRFIDVGPGDLRLEGNLSPPIAISGSIKGTASATFNKRLKLEKRGRSLEGTFHFSASGEVDADWSPRTIRGEIDASLVLTGSARFRGPGIIYGEWDLQTGPMTLRGDGTVTLINKNVNVDASVSFRFKGLKISGVPVAVAYTLN